MEEMGDEFWWSMRKLEDLVELYKGSPCLYDTMLPDYNNKWKRQQALEFMAQSLGTNKIEVARKIRNLRTVYSRKKKEGKSRQSGDGGGDASRQTWWLLPHLEFLDNFVGCKKTISNMKMEYVDNESSQDVEQKSDQDEAELPTKTRNTTEIPNSPTSTPEFTFHRPQGPKQRPKVKENKLGETDSQIMELAIKSMDTYFARPFKEDEFDVFGQFIANELRSLPLIESRRLKYNILAAVQEAHSPHQCSYTSHTEHIATTAVPIHSMQSAPPTQPQQKSPRQLP